MEQTAYNSTIGRGSLVLVERSQISVYMPRGFPDVKFPVSTTKPVFLDKQQQHILILDVSKSSYTAKVMGLHKTCINKFNFPKVCNLSKTKFYFADNHFYVFTDKVTVYDVISGTRLYQIKYNFKNIINIDSNYNKELLIQDGNKIYLFQYDFNVTLNNFYFALIIAIDDNYLKLSSTTNNLLIMRFINIALRLPLSLQMVLCNRISGVTSDFILSPEFESAFVKLVR